MNHYRHGILLIATALIGCQTTPSSHLRIIRGDEHANVTIARDRGMIGVACTIDVLVDHAHVESLRAGQEADLHLEPGAHVLSIENNTPVFCMDMVDNLKINVSTDTIQHFRIFTPAEGATRILPE